MENYGKCGEIMENFGKITENVWKIMKNVWKITRNYGKCMENYCFGILYKNLHVFIALLKLYYLG